MMLISMTGTFGLGDTVDRAGIACARRKELA